MGTSGNGEKVTKNCRQNEPQKVYDNRTKENIIILDDQFEDEEKEDREGEEETEAVKENDGEVMHLRHDIAEVPEREVCLVRRESGFSDVRDVENQEEDEEEDKGTVLEYENDGEVMCLRHDIAEVPEREVCLVRRESRFSADRDVENQEEEEEEEDRGTVLENENDGEVMCLRQDIAEVPEREVCLVKRDSGLPGSKDMDNLMIAEGGLEDGATDSFIPAYCLRRKGNKNARFHLHATTIMVRIENYFMYNILHGFFYILSSNYQVMAAQRFFLRRETKTVH